MASRVVVKRAHVLVCLFRHALQQVADAKGVIVTGSQVHILHPKDLVAQVGHGVLAGAAGYRRRLRLHAIDAQHLAQPHVAQSFEVLAPYSVRRAQFIQDGLIVTEQHVFDGAHGLIPQGFAILWHPADNRTATPQQQRGK